MFQQTLRHAALGALSGLLAWAGAFVLPEGSLALKFYPGAVFGLVMFLLRIKRADDGAGDRGRALLVCLVAGTASWRFAIDIAFAHGGAIPFVVAGAAGGLIVAVGCLLAARPPRLNLPALLIVTTCGAMGGLVYQIIDALKLGLGESLWVLLLMVEWQTLVAMGIGFATKRKGARML